MTQMSTSLSWRTLVRFAYEPCVNTSMFLELSFTLAQIALRTARTALSHLVCSVVPGAVPHEKKVASQSRLGLAPPWTGVILDVDIKASLSHPFCMGVCL